VLNLCRRGPHERPVAALENCKSTAAAAAAAAATYRAIRFGGIMLNQTASSGAPRDVSADVAGRRTETGVLVRLPRAMAIGLEHRRSRPS
jgi:hypothetical protein